MASAATLVSPRLAHGSMMDSSSLSPSPIGLDNLSFDDLVEWNTNSYFNNNSNSNSNSPRMSNATLNSNSTFTSSTQPHIPQADYSSTSAHMNNGNGSDSIPPSNSTPEDLFRHYLSLELRKIGSPVNDSLLDHYVKQHAQGLARVNGGGAIQPSHATSSSSSSRENSPPELDPTASNSSSTSSNAASPTFSRRAFSLSPLPEEAGEDQDRTAKAFKIHQENDGQFSHFGRSSLGMGMGMSLENSGFGNDINGGQQDSEMSSIDPSSLIIKKQSDAISEDEDETGNADETLVDSKNDLAAIIAKNLSEEDSKKQSQSSSTQDTQSSTTNIIPSVEKPPSAFDSFKPPRIGEPPLNPNYSHPSSVKPVLNRNKKNGGDDEDEIMITTNAVSYDDPDKPTPEEYKKMTSKEKRQLRNKISARNFRERRKDYIAQLEREMQERDYTIASLRAQLERVGLQNQDLKKEVKTLRCSASAAAVVPTPETVAPSKPAATSSGSAIGASISQADVQRILDALQKSTVATQTQPEVAASNEATPRTAPVLSTSTTTATSSRPATPTSLRPISPRPSSSSSPIPVPNTRKDAFLSSDGSNSTSSFWAGGRSNSLLGGSGFMSVHTTLLPTIPFNPTTNVVVKKGKVNGGLSEKKSNFGLTFKGLNNHLRTFKSEKIANNEKSFLPPPAYSDHSFFDFKKSEKMMKREPVGESFDVYDAFASLLNQDPTSKQPVQELNLEEVDEEDRGDEALPTYVESILTSSQPTSVTSSLSPSLSDEAVEDRVLEALYKAFSNDNSSTSSFYPLDSKNSMAQKQDVDLNKIAALLDGKAELVLVDSESRREWNGQEAARVDGGLGYNARAIMARH